MPATSQVLRYSEIIAIDLSSNAINFADADTVGHRVQVTIAKEDLNLYFKWSRTQGSDRPVGYIDDIAGFRACLNTCFSDGFTDLDAISNGLSYTTGSLANAQNRSGTVNDLAFAYILFKVYGSSAYDTDNKVYNTGDALNMVANADVSTAIGSSIQSQNGRGQAVDKMFRDLLTQNPGRFFTAQGIQLPGLFETNTDVTGAGTWHFIENDIVQIVLSFVFQEQVSRRVVSAYQHPTVAGGTAEKVTEEVIIPAGSTFQIRLQLKGTATRSQARIDQLANGGGGGGGGGGLGWTIVDGGNLGGAVLTGYTATLPAILELPTTVDGSTVVATGDNLFNRNIQLQSLTIPAGINIISNGLCSRCTNLSSVTINSSPGALPAYGFQYCGNLTSINVPTSVTLIADTCFKQCVQLGSIVLTNVTELGERAFNTCTSLSNVQDTSNLTTLGVLVFENCTQLTSIDIPSLTVLGEACFRNSGLQSISIPGAIVSIPVVCFNNCSNLTTVELNYGTETIGQQAFSYSGLEQIRLPTSLTGIGGASFFTISTLQEITIPSACDSIGDSCFENSSNLKVVYFEARGAPPTLGATPFKTLASNGTIYYPSGTVNGSWESALSNATWTGSYVARTYELTHTASTITGFTGTLNSNVYIPGVLNGSWIRDIGADSFTGDMNVYTVDMSPFCTTIGNAAFKNCENITAITLPSAVTRIKSEAFSGCSGLLAISLPSGLIELEDQAFYSCTSLTTITIPSGITSIPQNFIAGSFSLQAVTLPNTLTSISDYAFYGCTALLTIDIPSTVTTIGSEAFTDCTSLSLNFLGLTPPTFGQNALATGTSSGEITIPNGANLPTWTSAVETAGWTGTISVK